jgi:hypothetical protein
VVTPAAPSTDMCAPGMAAQLVRIHIEANIAARMILLDAVDFIHTPSRPGLCSQ